MPYGDQLEMRYNMVSGISGASACAQALSSAVKSKSDYVSSKTSTTASDTEALFKTLDADGNGSISSSELSDQADALFSQLREQLSGSAIGGASASRPPPPPPPPAKDSAELFAKIDQNSDGSIDKTELSSFFTEKTDGASSGPSTDSNGDIKALMALIQQYASVSTTTAQETDSASISLSA
jgi:Ca2+-binding EF-hand superfamily protein